jgi:hypothetical protein
VLIGVLGAVAGTGAVSAVMPKDVSCVYFILHLPFLPLTSAHSQEEMIPGLSKRAV